MLRYVLTGRNPFAVIRHYDADGRGMDFWHDVRDWVGGFPYEYATAGEVFSYLHHRHGLTRKRGRNCAPRKGAEDQ